MLSRVALALLLAATGAEKVPPELRGPGLQLGDLEPEPEPVADRATFADAIARALRRSPAAGIALAELRRAGALLEQARAASLPLLTVAGEYARFGPNALAKASFDISSATGATLVALDNWLLGAQLTLPLFAPTAWAQWAHAVNDRTVAEWTAKEESRQLALGAAHAYLAIIAQKRIVDSNRRATQTDRVHYDYTRARHAGGLGTSLDEMRARQQYQSDLATFQAALLGLERAQEALGVMLGEQHPVDILGEPQLETPRDLAPDQAEAAERERPDLQEGEAAERAARQIDRDDWLDFLPSFSASFQPTLQTPPIAPGLPLTWATFLTLNWTLYDGGLRYGQHRERSERLLEAELTLKKERLQADSEVRVGFKAVRRSEQALAAARAAAEAAHQAFQVADQQYQAGATTNIDVVDAERRAHDADTAAAVAEDNERQARLDLLGALGRFP